MNEDDPLTILPPAAKCTYTSHYCEENVWHLCRLVADYDSQAGCGGAGGRLERCHVVFVSNASRQTPLWRQRSAINEQQLVVWDYHVFLLYQVDTHCFVYDLDSRLSFPTHFHQYASETLRSDHALQPQYHRLFRVVPAPLFLRTFASDRSHMRRDAMANDDRHRDTGDIRGDGRSGDSDVWISPPPAYPVITTAECSNNLQRFISMDASVGYGRVMSLADFVARFQKCPVGV